VFGICAGSLLLAASGVLKGRTAGGHWLSRALLSEFGVVPSDARLTIDGKFYASGGVGLYSPTVLSAPRSARGACCSPIETVRPLLIR